MQAVSDLVKLVVCEKYKNKSDFYCSCDVIVIATLKSQKFLYDSETQIISFYGGSKYEFIIFYYYLFRIIFLNKKIPLYKLVFGPYILFICLLFSVLVFTVFLLKIYIYCLTTNC